MGEGEPESKSLRKRMTTRHQLTGGILKSESLDGLLHGGPVLGEGI